MVAAGEPRAVRRGALGVPERRKASLSGVGLRSIGSISTWLGVLGFDVASILRAQSPCWTRCVYSWLILWSADQGGMAIHTYVRMCILLLAYLSISLSLSYIYIYIHIYTYREREGEIEMCLISSPARGLRRCRARSPPKPSPR